VHLLATADPTQLEARELLLQRTPLALAVRKGNQAVVDELLAFGASPLARDAIGWTPYTHAMYAALGGRDRGAAALSHDCMLCYVRVSPLAFLSGHDGVQWLILHRPRCH